MSRAIEITGLDLVFGAKPEKVFPMLDIGLDRATIFQKTAHTVAVRNLNLAIDTGETVVIMGLSGSGKSSLLRCINGMNGRRGGTGTLRGQVIVHTPELGSMNLVGCSEHALRKLRTQSISMVFQQSGLLPWRTVLDNVALPLELQKIPSKKRFEKAHEKLELVGLGACAGLLPHELSGGMQQRVGLARALITECPILLMDEPFSALDPLIRQQLQSELLNLRKTIGKTIVFVSHDMGEALRLGSRIVIMEDGEILQQGTPNEIMNTPNSPRIMQFVAHANPLHVLTGESLMTRFEALQKTTAGFDLDGTQRYFCRIGDAGHIEWLGDLKQSRALLRANGEPRYPQGEYFLSASASSTLAELIAYFQECHRPLILLDRNEFPIGVLSEQEIMKGLVKGKGQQEVGLVH